MARIRTIKPEFPQSESIGRLSRDARLLFVQLWTVSDDEGRARAASRMLSGLLYPYDDDAPRLIDGWLDELARENLIRRYEVDGTRYLEIVNWLKHQYIAHATPSRIPPFQESSRTPPDNSGNSPDNSRSSHEGARTVPETSGGSPNSSALILDLGSRTMDLGSGSRKKERARGALVWPFDEFWAKYPHKVGKQDALRAFHRAERSAATSFENLMLALDRYIAKRDDRPWCNPATWLNQGRWDDQPAPQVPRSQGPPPRAGSYADLRERTSNALASLDHFIERSASANGRADDASGSGSAREAVAGVLPFPKPA